MKSISVLVIATIFLATVVPHGEAAIDCAAVVSYMRPCIPYVTNTGPLGGCCNGVKRLYFAARTTPDRRSVCNCLKSLARSYPGNAVNKAAGVPRQCGVSVPYKISPSTDCSRVN